MEKIALIAGHGRLPALWAKKARERSHRVYAFPVQEEDTVQLTDFADKIYSINLGSLTGLINLINKNNINKVIMLGKIDKTHLFRDLELDERFKQLLAGLDDLNDESILRAIGQEFAAEGIEVIKQSTFLEELLPEPGVLTAAEPEEGLVADMDYAFRMAREIGRLEIGQTVIVKNQAVLAVEAIEGTDQAIKRGGKYGGQGVTMAKVSRPEQNMCFDIPTVGLTTLENLINIKARGLIVEANKTFLVDKNKLIKKANKAGITIKAME